jgi:hypothetical protein
VPGLGTFDGSIVDMATLLAGLVALLVKPVKRLLTGRRPAWIHRDCIVDFLNGCTTVPFVTLILAVYSKAFLDEVIKTNKVSLMVSGIIGLLFVLKEIFVEAPSNGGTVATTNSSDIEKH